MRRVFCLRVLSPPQPRIFFCLRVLCISFHLSTSTHPPSYPHTQMQKVVANLAEIEQPWNCPHGRPTMRHLVDLTTLHKELN